MNRREFIAGGALALAAAKKVARRGETYACILSGANMNFDRIRFVSEETEIGERREKLDRLAELKSGLKTVSSFSIETIGDIATVMESKKKLNTMYRNVFMTGIPLGILQIVSILLWIFKGIWWPFILWAVIAIPFSIFWTRYYYRHTAYICPQCHEVFRPAWKEAFFARHTMKTRKLTCVKCGHHGFCVETWGGDEA